jgi:hypothetical protein
MLGKLSIPLFSVCDLKYSIVEALVSDWSIDAILDAFLPLHWVLTLWPENQPVYLRAIPWFIGKVSENSWSITDPHKLSRVELDLIESLCLDRELEFVIHDIIDNVSIRRDTVVILRWEFYQIAILVVC